ncbi:MAG: homocysteine S-methyltransferase [Chloroflexota bacterium]
MNPLEAILAHNPLIILDGALATELERAGLNLDDPLWSAKVLLEAPEAIQAVHTSYLQAGADCLITATYQATYEQFRQRGLNDDEISNLMKLSVQLAVTARDEFWADQANRHNRAKPIIAASVGPYGAYLADGSEYRGNYGLTEGELVDFHRQRLTTLADTDADIFAFETIPCLKEAQALTKLLSTFPEKVAWVSFSAKDDHHISSGESFSDCVHWLNDYPQIVAVGINCTAPKHVLGLLSVAELVTSKPLIVYPNSGEDYDIEKRAWLEEPNQNDFAILAASWYQAGASIIGGCCRTTPHDIQCVTNWAKLITDDRVSP